jgi:DNA polymerase III subunit delta'
MVKSQLSFHWPLIGNQHIVDYLEKSLLADDISGTYIFNGPDGLGKSTLALHLAQSLLCENFFKRAGEIPCQVCPSCRRFNSVKIHNPVEAGQVEMVPAHGDFHLLRKESDKKNISIEQVRELINTLNLSSFLNSYKIGLIKEAESLSLEAANALLKTLEEPKVKVVIILITKDLELMPATIASRSKIFNFRPVRANLIYDYLRTNQASRSAAKDFSRLSLGRPAQALKLFSEPKYFQAYQSLVKAFLNFSTQDVNERFTRIEEISQAKEMNIIPPERVIEIWQGIVRDYLMLEYSQPQLIQHLFAEKEISAQQKKYQIQDLLAQYKLLAMAKSYLAANVNFKFVLESISLYL